MLMTIIRYLPEGYGPPDTTPLPLSEIHAAIDSGKILEGTALRCDRQQNLHIAFRNYQGIIPRAEAVAPEISGAGRDIALLSLVGRRVSFVITGVEIDGGGKPLLLLSRRKAQQQAMAHLFACCPPGTVVRGKITHLEGFGAFVDIGCGVIALLPLEYISISRISHPGLHLRTGQSILAVIKSADRDTGRFTLSHRELLGTWLENAALFAPGETVTGFVRGIRDYGMFIELTPNLSGLADSYPGLQLNDAVTVYIKSIRSQQMKIKLQILQKAETQSMPSQPTYFLTDGRLAAWRYAPPDCDRDFGSVTFS